MPVVSTLLRTHRTRFTRLARGLGDSTACFIILLAFLVVVSSPASMLFLRRCRFQCEEAVGASVLLNSLRNNHNLELPLFSLAISGENRRRICTGEHLCGPAGGRGIRRSGGERRRHVAPHRVHGFPRGRRGRRQCPGEPFLPVRPVYCICYPTHFAVVVLAFSRPRCNVCKCCYILHWRIFTFWCQRLPCFAYPVGMGVVSGKTRFGLRVRLSDTR